MVTVYSKPQCSHCESTKQVLSNMDIMYEVKDVSEDEVARSFLIGEGHRSVPQIYQGDDLLIEGGYPTLRQMTNEQLLGVLNVSEIKV